MAEESLRNTALPTNHSVNCTILSGKRSQLLHVDIIFIIAQWRHTFDRSILVWETVCLSGSSGGLLGLQIKKLSKPGKVVTLSKFSASVNVIKWQIKKVLSGNNVPNAGRTGVALKHSVGRHYSNRH